MSYLVTSSIKLFHFFSQRTQGGCVSSIKPEYLMEVADYKVWAKLQKAIQAYKSSSGHVTSPKTEEEEALEDQLFEAVSKRAWTDILMQLLKVGTQLLTLSLYM